MFLNPNYFSPFTPFSTRTCFHILSGDYLLILYSFRNSVNPFSTMPRFPYSFW
ncbi:hypothetical protein E2C01_083340 [Portunus trituberculatus]|uniref:Uncharacterized protein n=1 Tax=Portunus trituberculatus TaxID=210409 RepID=A0A5B7J4D8_PORTR|nr:hypothetical protein [Portunus trituberculatus]